MRRLALALTGIVVLFWVAALIDLDDQVTSLFYTDRGEEPWPLGEHPFWQAIDRYGQLPGALMAVLAAVLLWRYRGQPDRARTRRDCWLLVLLVVLGAGALIHGMRATWGRPRPRNVLHWQDPRPHREWWQPGGPGAGSSFPSGHVALSVTLVAGAFVVTRRRSPGLRATVTGAALALAALVSMSRMLDGAHHATDVLWSWVLMLMFWWGLERFLPPPTDARSGTPPVETCDAG